MCSEEEQEIFTDRGVITLSDHESSFWSFRVYDYVYTTNICFEVHGSTVIWNRPHPSLCPSTQCECLWGHFCSALLTFFFWLERKTSFHWLQISSLSGGIVGDSPLLFYLLWVLHSHQPVDVNGRLALSLLLGSTVHLPHLMGWNPHFLEAK